ncbi:tetratricopeptide repeat protein [Sphingomonas sp. GlSt437]|uniref:tetratricopeptide repeat protein n=1 Tax=Sphingomonas sp. GlSt437 TaxID=3389970 RepID=UPI003A898041
MTPSPFVSSEVETRGASDSPAATSSAALGTNEGAGAPGATARRRGWKRRSGSGRLRRWLVGLLIALAGVAVMAAGVAAWRSMPVAVDPAAAREELRKSLALLAADNASSARLHAHLAVQRDPKWGLAHAVLARAMLAMGDGPAAQGELTRAVDAGFDPARAHHLFAHAYLLQGDPAHALAEARRADPRYAGYATRIAALALAQQGDLPRAQAMLGTLLAASGGADAQAWADLGRVRQMTGDLAGAAAAADRALAIDPRLVRATVLRAELIRDQYGLTAALPWFEAALKVDPADHDALIGYAATLGEAGRYTDMLAATRRALVTRPNSAQALYLQAVMAARARRIDVAQAIARRMAGSFADLPGPLMLTAMLDLANGADQPAVVRLRRVIGQQPMNIAARRLLASALMRSGDWRGALDVLRPVAIRGDADSYTLTLVARAFEATGERDWAARFIDRAALPALATTLPFGTDDSLDDLRAAAEARPGDPVAAVGYIRGLIDAHQPAAALAEAQRLARVYPGVPQAQTLVGDVLMSAGRAADAASAYQRAANLRFDEPALLRLIDAYDRSGQHPKSAAALALFLDQHPRNTTALRLAAHWQIAAGDWAAAIDTLEGLRDRVGNRDAALLGELAAAYSGDGQDDVARVYAARAYDLAPLNPAVVDVYGWVLYQAGDEDAGRQLLDKAVAIAPAHAGLRWHHAQIAADMGDNDVARVDIAAALADPAFADRAAAIALLKTLG